MSEWVPRRIAIFYLSPCLVTYPMPIKAGTHSNVILLSQNLPSDMELFALNVAERLKPRGPRQLNVANASPLDVARWSFQFSQATLHSQEIFSTLRNVANSEPQRFSVYDPDSIVDTEAKNLAEALAEACELGIGLIAIARGLPMAADPIELFLSCPISVESTAHLANDCAARIAIRFEAKSLLSAVGNEVKADITDGIRAIVRARPYEIEALTSYAEAVKAKPELSDATMKETWDWIHENGIEIDGEEYALPKFSTWSTYVRKAKRKAIEQQSHDPRGQS